MGPFISQKTISMTFFIDSYTWNIFFSGESVCFQGVPGVMVKALYCGIVVRKFEL